MNNLRLALIVLTIATSSACSKSGAKFGDMGLPADCEASCPTGYSCDNGVCTGGNAQALAINLVTYPIAGTLLVNSQPPAPAANCTNRNLNVIFTSNVATLNDGFFQLAQATYVEDPLDCADTTGAVAVRLPAGSYSVLTQSYDEDSSIPDGVMPIQSGTLTVSGPVAAATWTAKTVTVSGTIKINGAPPVATTSCATSQGQLSVSFTDDAGAAFSTTVPCTSATGAFSLLLPPGTYKVVASGNSNASSFPSGSTVVQASLVVSGAVSGLALAATSVPVSGVVTINGAAPAPTNNCGFEQLDLTFSDGAGNAFTSEIDCTNKTGAFALDVAPGTYKVSASTDGPGNTSFPSGVIVLQSSLKVSGAATNVTLAAKTVSVSGTMTIDGAAPPPYEKCTTEAATINFTSSDGSALYTTIPCASTTGAFSIALPTGTYAVQAQELNFNPALSSDTLVTVQPSLSVSGAMTNVALAAKTVPVSGTLTVDGAPLAAQTRGCSSDLILLSFVDAAGATYEADIACDDTTGAFSLRLAPGTYRVLAHAQGEATLGWNTFQLVDALEIPKN